MTTADYSAIPLGLHLTRAFHDSLGDYVLHVDLKTHNAAWQDQPACPFYSEQSRAQRYDEFWAWAKNNLPIYEYPNAVKAAIA